MQKELGPARRLRTLDAFGMMAEFDLIPREK